MTHTTPTAGRLARALALVICLLGSLPLMAEAPTSDDINDAILVEGSVPVKWTNDATYPWEVGEGRILTPLLPENNLTSTLVGTYTSTYPTEISFEAYRAYYSSTEKMEIYIDDELYVTAQESSWKQYAFCIPAGSHTLKLVNHVGTSASREYRGGMRNLRVLECRELESACLTPNSMPITFVNDPEHPWITDDGFIRSNAKGLENHESTISTTFTLDRHAKLSFYWQGKTTDTYYQQMRVNIDGVPYSSASSKDWSYEVVVLEPGTHRVEFTEWHRNDGSYVGSLRDVELIQDWIDVTLANPGDLGREILYKVENLQDVELLKVNGSLNDADWNVMTSLTNIKAIDLTNTDVESIPNNAFYQKKWLCTVLFPETLKKIGENAFQETHAYRYHIPASVERIEDEAWYKSWLQEITFAEGSRLSYIGGHVFYNCAKLLEFIMPDSVTELSTDGQQFYSCDSLVKLHFSNALLEIPHHCAYYCYKIEELKLPNALSTIGSGAFYNCSSLKEVILPEDVASIGNDAFRACTGLKKVILNTKSTKFKDCEFYEAQSLETIICPVATPPTIANTSYPPFSSSTRSKIKLIVPDFALEDYKLDGYWNKFIVEAGDESSVRDYWYIGNRLTLDKGKRIRNTPEVEMAVGSSIWIDGETPQPFGKFTYSTRENAPAAFHSQTEAVTATDLLTRFYIDTAEKWFFFSPAADVDFAGISHTATDAWVIRRYNGERRASQNASSGNWETVTDGKLLRGEGYIVRSNKAGWLLMPVAKDAHSQFFGSAESTLPIAAYPCPDQPANADWNFLGNPYPTCFDIHDMDMEAPITVWTGSTYKALSLSDDRYVLRPMQPFFVQKPEECDALVMLREGKQLTTTPSAAKVRRRVAQAGRDLINLSVRLATDSLEHDMTRVVVNENASLGYEAKRDASKFMSMDPAAAQIYSFDPAGRQMAINERPYAEGSVRLGLYLPLAGEYAISAERMDRLCWLYDAERDITHSFSYGPYTFAASGEGLCNDRFILGFAPADHSGVEGLLGAEESGVSVKGSLGAVLVSAPAGSDVALYGVDGTCVAKLESAGETISIPAEAGMYVVVAGGESFTVIVK